MVNRELSLARMALGSLLMGVGSARDFTRDDFTNQAHRLIFDCLAEMGEPSLERLHTALASSGQPEKLWQSEFFRLDEHAVANAYNLELVRSDLRAERRRRNLAGAASELGSQVSGRAPDADLRETAATIETLIRDTGDGEPEHIRDRMAETFLVGEQPHVPMPLSGLDRLRIIAGNLAVIAARPGQGKTALLGNVALSAAAHGWNVLLLSLEMPALEIRQRLLAGFAGIPLGAVQACSDPRMIEQAGALSQLPIWLEDEAVRRLSLESIEAVTRTFIRRHGAERAVLLVDYLQLVTTRARYERRYEAIGHVCRELKHLALGQRLPVIVAAQLSRTAEERQGGRPQLSDLRESGEIEQTADQVVLIHRENDAMGDAKLRVAKNRMGELFTCEARFAGERCQFEDRQAGGWQ